MTEATRNGKIKKQLEQKSFAQDFIDVNTRFFGENVIKAMHSFKPQNGLTSLQDVIRASVVVVLKKSGLM